jgi:hypothetical protein
MVKRVTPSWICTVLVSLLLAGCERQGDDEPTGFIALVTDMPCDLKPGCVAGTENFSVNILIDPGARALQPFDVRARLLDDVPVTAIEVGFVMPGMQMGLNRYALVHEGDDIWRARVTLPVCMSGRSDWVAEFEFLADQRRMRFDAPFSLGK